jgi:hypothetical protein
VRIAAYDLMRELADARDQEVRLRVVTGELGSEQADNRRTANAAMRDQAATGLAALTER